MGETGINKTETAVQSQDDEKNYMTDKTYKKTYLLFILTYSRNNHRSLQKITPNDYFDNP